MVVTDNRELRIGAWCVDPALDEISRDGMIVKLEPRAMRALGDQAWTAGRFAEAEAAYRKAVELGPSDGGLHALLANILLSTHKATEAVVEAEREPDAEWRETALLFALDAAGRRSDADRAIAAYEVKHAADDPGGIAAFYACRRDTERAIRWLKAFVGKQEGEYHDLPNREACFKTAESDARFQALRRQMKAESPKPVRLTN